MIRELINFSESLGVEFKNSGIKSSKGLHVAVDINELTKKIEIVDIIYVFGNENGIHESQSDWLFYEKNCQYITMNKVQKFDPKQKIHSCSPFAFAFNFSLGAKKKELLEIIESEITVEERGTTNDINKLLDRRIKEYKIGEVKKSIDAYFFNSINLCLLKPDEIILNKINSFKDFCKKDFFDFFDKIIVQKDIVKKNGEVAETKVLAIDELGEKDYVRVYFRNIPKEQWEKSYNYYCREEYFNTSDFNSTENENGEIYGTSDFINTLSEKKPFLKHLTASFLVNSRITGQDAKTLNTLKQILKSKIKFDKKEKSIIPKPLPIFIFQEELQKRVVGLFNEHNCSLSYKEIIEHLWANYKDDFNNYYLMYWYYGKDIVIQDFDYVSKFEYEIVGWKIENPFSIKEIQTKQEKVYPPINTVFDLEQIVFKNIIGNKYNSIDYFKDLDNEDYKDYSKNKHSDNTFYAYSKYRKGVYDFVYKSKRQAIDKNAFYDMVFSGIQDNLKQNNEYALKDKLNMWFSLNSKFDLNKTNKLIDMASKLKEYQQFVTDLAENKPDIEILTDEQFAFAAGQVIDYILKKSKSADQSFKLLEPYLQQSKCEQFKSVIANDFARYKHENYSNRFKAVADDVLSYETSVDLKKLLPEILAGIFSPNQLFPFKKDNSNN